MAFHFGNRVAHGRRCTFGTFIVMLVLAVAPRSPAQPAPAGSPRPVLLEQYVPASARLFVKIRKLGEVNAALHRAHAWQLLPLIAGESPDGRKPVDLRAALTRLLGPRSSVPPDELSEVEIGIVADSWTALGGAVWLVRISHDAVLDRWFPKKWRRNERKGQKARSFRTTDGLRIVVRDRIVAMARRSGAGSLLSQTGRLMVRPGDGTLRQAPHYQELIAHLPAGELAVAYFNRGEPHHARPASGSWWPALERAAIGVYENEGLIDFAVRGARTESRTGVPVALDAFGRLVRLPRTTLFASATTVDFARALATATQNPAAGTLGRYLNLLSGVGTSESRAAELLGQLGPHLIMAWDQDLGEDGTLPQFALMVESTDAGALRDETTQMAANAVRLMQSIDPIKPEAVPTVQRNVHLGTPIFSLPLRGYAEHSRFSSVRLMGGLEPAWAAWGNWFVVALTRDHLERIVDAQYGLIPRLVAVADVRELNYYKANRTTVSIGQAGPAAAVLSRWLKSFEDGDPSFLDPSLWEPPTGANLALRRDLGIGVSPGYTPGVIAVETVDPGSPGAGLLRHGDRIIGIDGLLLDLESPDTSLRQQLKTAASGPKLRVQRGDTMVNVVLPEDMDFTEQSSLPIAPARAVRELASLGRTLQFAIFSVHATRDTHYSAKLTLRFAPVDSPNAAGGRSR